MKFERAILVFVVTLISGVLVQRVWAQDQINNKNNEIKIGALYSLTGWAAVGGIPEYNATQLAVDEINRTGGILGKQIKLALEDAQSDLRRTVNATKKLISVDKVDVLLGPNWAEFSEITAPLCEQNKVVMLTASGYTPTLTVGRSYVFTTLPSHQIVAKPLADYLVRRKHKKLSLATSTTTFFESNSSAVKSLLAESGLKFESESTWNPGSSDFKTYITKLKDSNYDGVVLMLQEGGDMSSFLRQARELHFTGQLYASNALLTDHVVLDNLSLAEGVIFYEYRTIATEKFLSDYRSKYREVSSIVIPKAYDNVYLVKDAAERCGTLDSVKLKECLRSTDYKGVSGRIRFTKSGNMIPDSAQSTLYIIKDGKVTPFVG